MSETATPAAPRRAVSERRPTRFAANGEAPAPQAHPHPHAHAEKAPARASQLLVSPELINARQRTVTKVGYWPEAEVRLDFSGQTMTPADAYR